MRKRFGVFLMAALGAAVATAVVGPVQAMAYQAKGIVSTGLVYDDVYGVFDGYALMKKGESIDLVNSSGQVVKSTKKNTDGWIEDSSRFEMADGLLGTRAADGYGFTSINGKQLLPNEYSQTSYSGDFIVGLKVSNGEVLIDAYRKDGTYLSRFDCGRGTDRSGISRDDSAFLIDVAGNDDSRTWYKLAYDGDSLGNFSRVDHVAKNKGTASDGSEFVVSVDDDNSTASISHNGKTKTIYDATQAYIYGDFVRVTTTDNQKHWYTYEGESAAQFDSYDYLQRIGSSTRYIALKQNQAAAYLVDSQGTILKSFDGQYINNLSRMGEYVSLTSLESQGFRSSLVNSTGDEVFSCVDLLDLDNVGINSDKYFFVRKGSGQSSTCEVYTLDNLQKVASLSPCVSISCLDNDWFVDRVCRYPGDNNSDNYSGPDIAAGVHSVNDFSSLTVAGYSVAACRNTGYKQDNSPRHGSSGGWWSRDEDGKWGMVDGSGEVVVPFEYDAYEDVSSDGEPLVLVKKAGSWYFFDTSETTPSPEPSDGGAMWRLYNPYTGEHFYTSSASERDGLVAAGWESEGEGWKAPESSRTPVYRLYNPYAPGGDHHYTMSAAERDELVAAGWRYEGVGWYSDDDMSVPLYRQYNPYAATGSHNYTTSRVENDSLVAAGWRAEGVAWYGMD